jgi:hypothetical protein
MKLSAEEIDQLYTFTRQHHVEYYDLQTELVDHLANAIELEWETNPSQSFETLLNKEFKKFGVYGFIDVLRKKQKAMNKRYFKWVWNHFKAFFKLPKIIGTVIVITAVFYFLKFNDNNLKIIRILFAIQLAIVFFALIKRELNKNKNVLNSKKWLLENTIYRCGNFASLFNLPFFAVNSACNSFTEITEYFLLGISCFFVCCGLFFYIILFEIPSKAQEYLEKTYPEYKVSNQ